MTLQSKTVPWALKSSLQGVQKIEKGLHKRFKELNFHQEFLRDKQESLAGRDLQTN
jgi:hypothetical protein